MDGGPRRSVVSTCDLRGNAGVKPSKVWRRAGEAQGIKDAVNRRVQEAAAGARRVGGVARGGRGGRRAERLEGRKTVAMESAGRATGSYGVFELGQRAARTVDTGLDRRSKADGASAHFPLEREGEAIVCSANGRETNSRFTASRGDAGRPRRGEEAGAGSRRRRQEEAGAAGWQAGRQAGRQGASVCVCVCGLLGLLLGLLSGLCGLCGLSWPLRERRWRRAEAARGGSVKERSKELGLGALAGVWASSARPGCSRGRGGGHVR